MSSLFPIGLYNLDIILIGIAVAAILILGFVIFFNNPRSTTHRTFLFLSLMTSAWSTLNYFTYQVLSPEMFILILRLAIFFAVWNSLAVFQLFLVFPEEKYAFPRWFKAALVPFVAVVAVVTLTPLVFSGTGEISSRGLVITVINGPAIPLFGATVIGLVLGGFLLVVRRMRNAVGMERTQLRYITTGAIISFSLIIVFNLVFPAFLNDSTFVSLGAIFLFPFILLTFYVVARHNFLDVRIASTEIFTFSIVALTLGEFLLAKGLVKLILRSLEFFLVLGFAVLLIRGVRKQIEQRQRLEGLTKELGAANTRLLELDQMKTDFVSIASHQLRTPLTAIKGYSSMVLEESYGQVPLQIRGILEKILESSQRLIYIVNDLLDISRIEQGKLTLNPEEVKVVNIIKNVVDELKINADKKGIALEFEVSPDDADLTIKADLSKIRQVFVNLIDNSIKYTFSGFVRVSLEKKDGAAIMSVKDSGIGMSEDTLTRLFQKFSRARGIAKFRADGSGVGLYIVKEIVSAHGGKAWGESEGEGKGSQFYVSLPLFNPGAEEIQKFAEGI